MPRCSTPAPTSWIQVQTIITRDIVPVIAVDQPKWTTVLHNSVEGFVFNPINLGTYDFWSMSRKA